MCSQGVLLSLSLNAHPEPPNSRAAPHMRTTPGTRPPRLSCRRGWDSKKGHFSAPRTPLRPPGTARASRCRRWRTPRPALGARVWGTPNQPASLAHPFPHPSNENNNRRSSRSPRKTRAAPTASAGPRSERLAPSPRRGLLPGLPASALVPWTLFPPRQQEGSPRERIVATLCPNPMVASLTPMTGAVPCDAAVAPCPVSPPPLVPPRPALVSGL